MVLINPPPGADRRAFTFVARFCACVSCGGADKATPFSASLNLGRSSNTRDWAFAVTVLTPLAVWRTVRPSTSTETLGDIFIRVGSLTTSSDRLCNIRALSSTSAAKPALGWEFEAFSDSFVRESAESVSEVLPAAPVAPAGRILST